MYRNVGGVNPVKLSSSASFHGDSTMVFNSLHPMNYRVVRVTMYLKQIFLRQFPASIMNGIVPFVWYMHAHTCAPFDRF